MLVCRFSIITTFTSKNFRHGVNHHKVSMTIAYTCISSAVAIQAMFLEKTDSVCWNKHHTCKFHSTQIPLHSPKNHLWPCLTMNIWIDNQSNNQGRKGNWCDCKWDCLCINMWIFRRPALLKSIYETLHDCESSWGVFKFIRANVSHCYWTNTHQI